MADQVPRGPDPDDWWASTPGSRPAGAQLDDDWLVEPPREPRFGFPATVTLRTLLLIGAGLAAVIVLVIGLIAGGVFSSGSSNPPPTTPATTTAQNTTPTTPTTTPAAAVPAPTVTLKPGASGPQTKRLQRALASLGFSPGKVDGTYGPATTTAVQKFQRSVHLTADGVVGPKTLAALKTALKG